MNTVSFQSFRPELSLKRRDPSSSTPPIPFDNTVPFEGNPSTQDPYGHTSLQAAWDKLYRARALLEAEQVHLRDDRIAFQGELDEIKRREDAVRARELRVQQLELQQSMERQDATESKTKSAIVRLTQAPFEAARSIFGSKK